MVQTIINYELGIMLQTWFSDILVTNEDERGITNWGGCLNLDLFDYLDYLDFDHPKTLFIL